MTLYHLPTPCCCWPTWCLSLCSLHCWGAALSRSELQAWISSTASSALHLSNVFVTQLLWHSAASNLKWSSALPGMRHSRANSEKDILRAPSKGTASRLLTPLTAKCKVSWPKPPLLKNNLMQRVFKEGTGLCRDRFRTVALLRVVTGSFFPPVPRAAALFQSLTAIHPNSCQLPLSQVLWKG